MPEENAREREGRGCRAWARMLDIGGGEVNLNAMLSLRGFLFVMLATLVLPWGAYRPAAALVSGAPDAPGVERAMEAVAPLFNGHAGAKCRLAKLPGSPCTHFTLPRAELAGYRPGYAVVRAVPELIHLRSQHALAPPVTPPRGI